MSKLSELAISLDLAAEEAYIANAFVSKTFAIKYADTIDADHFCDYKTREAFRVIEDAVSVGKAPEYMELCEKMRKEEMWTVDVLDKCSTKSDEYIIERLEKYKKIRKVAAIMIETQERLAIEPECVDEAIESLLSLQAHTGNDKAFPEYSMHGLAIEKVKELEGNTKNRTIYHLGIPKIDDLLRLVSGNILFIQAPPKTGKTWMQTVILNFLAKRHKTYMVSAEMHPKDLFMRSMSNLAGHDLTALDYLEKPPKRLYSYFSDAISDAINLKITMVKAAGIKFNQLVPKIRMAINSGNEIIVLDYLQRIENSNAKDERIAILKMSRELTNLAKQSGKLFIVAMQANEPPPGVLVTSTYGKESKAPREDCDAMLSITNTTHWTRDWKTKKEIENTWKKGDNYKIAVEIFQRNGYCGMIGLDFDPTTGRYIDLDAKEESQPEQYWHK